MTHLKQLKWEVTESTNEYQMAEEAAADAGDYDNGEEDQAVAAWQRMSNARAALRVYSKKHNLGLDINTFGAIVSA